MKPLFHFADLWKCFIRLFKNTDRVNTEDGSTLYMQDNLAVDGNFATSGDVLIEGNLSLANEFVDDMPINSNWLNGLTASNVYSKIMCRHDILYLVVSLRLTNPTESSVSTSSTNITSLANLLSETISNKIYRKDGSKVSTSQTNSDDVSGALIHITSPVTGESTVKYCNLYSSSPNDLRIWSSSGSLFSVGAGESADVDIRTFLIL